MHLVHGIHVPCSPARWSLLIMSFWIVLNRLVRTLPNMIIKTSKDIYNNNYSCPGNWLLKINFINRSDLVDCRTSFSALLIHHITLQIVGSSCLVCPVSYVTACYARQRNAASLALDSSKWQGAVQQSFASNCWAVNTGNEESSYHYDAPLISGYYLTSRVNLLPFPALFHLKYFRTTVMLSGNYGKSRYIRINKLKHPCNSYQIDRTFAHSFNWNIFLIYCCYLCHELTCIDYQGFIPTIIGNV